MHSRQYRCERDKVATAITEPKYAERFVRSIKESCLERLILFGEASLRRAIQNFIPHYHEERNHQGKGNQLLFPRGVIPVSPHHGIVQCQQRIGGLLKYYHREAA